MTTAQPFFDDEPSHGREINDMTDVGQPMVSVIIPSHNRPQLVAQAVESVLAQNHPTEIIVIDDGSDPALTAEGVLAHPVVRLLRNDVAQGPTRARNVGIDAATGTYMAFLDDDDIWLPGKLSACVRAAQSGPEGALIVHRTTDGIAPARRAPNRPPETIADPARWYGRHQTPHLDSVFLETELAKAVRFDDSFAAAEDVDFVLELAKLRPFVLIREVLAVRGEGNDSGIDPDARIAGRELLRIKHPDIVDADPQSRAFFHVRMGHLHLAAATRGRAVRSFVTALRHLPTDRGAWIGLIGSMLPRRVLARLSSWNRSRQARRG